MNDLVSNMFVMTLDIYKQFDEQDTMSGAIKKEWHFIESIPCYAKGIISNSGTSRTSDKSVIGNKYEYVQTLEVRTARRLTLREKVTNIRNSDGYVIWTELDAPTETPTVFEVIGTTPITDPFGSVLAYNSTLKRSENQQIGI
jgi:hypothetical protein